MAEPFYLAKAVVTETCSNDDGLATNVRVIIAGLADYQRLARQTLRSPVNPGGCVQTRPGDSRQKRIRVRRLLGVPSWPSVV